MVGRYRVARRLGSGGFARVYAALDPDLELDVAVKVLRPELAADPDTVDRFRREATMAARLRHPNVITVLTVGRLETAFDGAAPDTPYLVMDLLPDSLADRLAGGGTLASDEVARVGAEVARGLGFAHRHGIVHRDVKPENVLFARDGRAVVTDFGIARAVAGSPTASSRQVVLGTPTFFSPEQARGLPLDGRSDVYALGVTLFRAATGVLPFPGEDWYEVMRQHVEAAPPRARAVTDAVTPALDSVIARCLAKRPDDRFATADELATALEQARGARPSGVATVVVPVAAAAGRRPRVGWLIGVSAAAIAAVAVARRGDFGTLRQPGSGSTTAPREVGAASGVALGAAAPGGLPSAGMGAGAPGVGFPTGGALAPAGDSVRRRPADSARLAAARTALPTLLVSAPADAEVYVDGVMAGRGPVRRDALRPGRHQVRAIIAALPGCPSADTSVVVQLASGARQQLTLEPAACGWLGLDVLPAAARYRLAPVRGGAAREGELPLAAPLYLPAGDYTLTLEATQCSTFSATVPVVARATRRERIPLICN
jgi:serine/threonine-protein kinase